jgi:PAS domain S-box-containing protein
VSLYDTAPQSDTDMLRRMSVLYVEDDEGMCDIVADMLARNVGSIVTATDGEEGLAVFQRVRPDIVISDIQMLRMDGLEMAAAIKRLSPSTPIIITTAFSDNDYLLKAIATGIDKLLIKPFDSATLHDALIQCARPLDMANRLRESEARYRTMMEQAADGIFLSDREGRYLAVNTSGCKMLGFSREEILQFNIRDLVSPERHANLARGLEDALAGKSYLVESVLRHKDGRYIDCEISVGMLSDGTIMATVRDISARKKAEHALQESEEKFRLIAENVDDLIALVDSEGNRIYNSPSYQKVFGRVPKCGTNSFQEIHPDDRERVHKIFQETVASGVGRQAKYRFQLDDGRVRFIESSASTIMGGNGKVAKVAVVSRDVTERHLAGEALAESHQRFLTVLDNMDALVYVADMQTHEILFANRYARELFGTELLGKICWQTLQAGQTGPCSFCTNNRLLTAEGKSAGVYVWEFQNTVNRRWFAIHDNAIRWVDGRMVRMEIATDITERKKMEEALRLSEISLSRAQRMAHVGSWEWRITEGVVAYSEETARIVGLAFPPGECTIEEFLKPVCVADKLNMLRAINAALFEGKPYEVEFCIERARGEMRHVRNQAEVEFDAAGRPTRAIGALQDITERRRLEKTILEISEKVRLEIGQELHDGLGQQLTGIGFASKLLESKLTKLSLPESQDAARIVQAVAHTMTLARELAKGLYPVELEENGLLAALEQLAIYICNAFGVECTFQFPHAMVSYKQDVAIHLYRIAQEAVSNAIKHGKANRIAISLFPDENNINLRIADNGAGLELSALPDSPGMGLRIMKYRASLIGASLCVQNAPQGGAIVIVH